MMFKYTKKRTHEGVPAWDILYGGNIIGLLTDLPVDGPKATVRISINDGYGYVAILERTVEASTITMCFERAKEAHEALIEDMVK